MLTLCHDNEVETVCIIAFEYKVNNQYDLVICANRDEFYVRPTKPAHLWETSPKIFAGKDIQEGGTWMGVTEHGKFVAITNYRDPNLEEVKTYSRGVIATNFLLGDVSAPDFAQQLQKDKDLYGPFNVLAYDGEDLIHYNNIVDEIQFVKPGIHCLCNATLNTPWPKTIVLAKDFGHILVQEKWSNEELLHILQNEQLAPDRLLPKTGVSYELEKALSAIFVKMENYGTRASTIIKLNKNGADFFEQTYERGTPTTSVQSFIEFK